MILCRHWFFKEFLRLLACYNPYVREMNLLLVADRAGFDDFAKTGKVTL